MYFSKATVLAFLATFAFSSALVVERQNGVTCQTSDGSPSTGDVTDVINQVRGKGGECPNTNGEASDCTTLVKHNSAAIGVCGGKDDDNSQLTCEQVASYANQIQQTCQKNGNAGGTFTVSASKRIIVFNSKDA